MWKPIIIVIAICIPCMLFASLFSAARNSASDYEQQTYSCTYCRQSNTVDSDLPVWSCRECGRLHILGQGKRLDTPSTL